MRKPWVPRVQSNGSDAGVKAVRRVTEVEREGSSERVMGEKRVSSNALEARGHRLLAQDFDHGVWRGIYAVRA